MEDVGRDPQLSELTAEMAWMRRLARAVLRDSDAEDLAQETWIVATERPPEDGRPLRPWLGRVMVNLARMGARSRRRREAREAKVPESEHVATPEELVQRVELQQLVAAEVLALAEPYRSTILLHFFEELTCAEIARRFELPEGTVRRRLKVALDELRARIAAKDRKRGVLALAPLAGIPSQSSAPLALGVIAMKKLIAAVVVLILIVIAGLWWTTRDKHDDGPRVASAGSGERAGTSTHAMGGGSAAGRDDGVPVWLAQPNAKSRRVSGHVTFRGAPVTGAIVELASVASESGLVVAPRVTTNAAGEFDFGAQRAMAWSVRASAPGKASARRDLDLRDPRVATEHLELELGGCDAALVGTVRDASGGAITNAHIAWLSEEPTRGVPGGPAATSDDKGAYELCFEVRWPGWVTVEVSAAGYAAVQMTTMAPGRVRVDFALVPEATIVGRVIRDDTGAPVPQAYVFVRPGASRSQTKPLRGSFTDANGRFELDRMTAGSHLVVARADGMVQSQGTQVAVGVGQSSVGIEIRLETGSTIRGKVVDHEKAVAGARVAIDGTHGEPTAMSQEDGTYVLNGVPHGELRFSAHPYDVVSPKTFQASLAQHDGVTIEVESLGTIRGLVVRDKQPVPGANMFINGPNDEELEPTRTDAQGRFEVRGLREGPWTVFAGGDHIGAFGRAPEIVHLKRGETAEVTIDLAYAASISGKVVDQNGSPVSGVTVTFRNTKSDDVGISATATDGSFRATTMTGGGQYRPIVAPSARAAAELRPASGSEFPLVALSDGSAEVTGIVLAVQLDHLVIAGKVVDSMGAPVADARVIAELTDGHGPTFWSNIAHPADTTSVDGRFSIPDLLAGSYAVRARSPSGVETIVPAIRAGRTDLSIVLPAAGGIDVTATGFQATPQVTAIRSGESTSSAPTPALPQANGFAIRDLAPGSYIVIARTPTESASAVVEVAAGRISRTTLTSGGTGVVAGRVREFRSGKPVEGMTCRTSPRAGIEATAIGAGEGARTDSTGAFTIAAAPAGAITVACDGLWRNFSDGQRMITLQAGQRADLDVRVVALSDEATGITIGDLGADFDPRVLVPRFVRVTPKGPAATAGFAEGDVITSVDDAPVTELSRHGVYILIVNRPPGTKIKLGVMRAGKPVSGEVTLREH